MAGGLRPVRMSWPRGKRLGREPGVQEVPAGTLVFGMGGITMPPQGLVHLLIIAVQVLLGNLYLGAEGREGSGP